jgi:uncharacterized repeat protein (TIGR03899 family)
MEDLFGFGKSTDKILDAVSNALGALYRPYGIKREADAEAYRQLTLGKAQAEAKAEEIRVIARAAADKTIILANAKEELKERARKRKELEELREQQNIDCVVQAAIDEGTSSESTEKVDPDWMNSFFTFAKSVSTEQMQALWGRALAKEIGQPGLFSIRSLETLKRMTRYEARVFTTACKLATDDSATTPRGMIITGYCHSSFSPFRLKEPQKIELRNFEFNILARKTLVSIGLLFEDEVRTTEVKRGTELYFAKSVLVLIPRKRKLHLCCLQLTPVGMELSNLIDKEKNTTYLTTLKEKLDSVVTRYWPKVRGNEFGLPQEMTQYFWHIALQCPSSA